MSRPTIGDVAAAAGVTRATVSHAFSGKRPISTATKERVFAAADQLGWVPSHSARALATQRANAVGMVLARDPDVIVADSFFPAFIAGLESALAEAEAALILQVVHNRDAEELAYRSMAAGRADGVVVLDLHMQDWRVPFLAELGLTTVLVGVYDGEHPFTTVRTDDGSPITELVAHLRAQAYLTAIGSDELLREGDFGAASGRDLTAELIELPNPPTAILYANDIMATAGLSLARSRGLQIPTDLAIAGFDDDHLSAHLSPPLTSVATDPARRGRIAGEALLADLAGAAPRRLDVECTRVQMRASTGAPTP